MAYLSVEETSDITQNRSNRDAEKKGMKDSFTSEEEEDVL